VVALPGFFFASRATPSAGPVISLNRFFLGASGTAFIRRALPPEPSCFSFVEGVEGEETVYPETSHMAHKAHISGDGALGLMAGVSFATLLVFGVLFVSFHLA
jgi:hypothetical protein